MNFGQSMITKKRMDKRDEAISNHTWAPKGFDISLANAISELDLDEAQIKTIGEMTARREIACATVGHNVFYRRSTLERLFNVK